jgi:hypothetical protein
MFPVQAGLNAPQRGLPAIMVNKGRAKVRKTLK